MRLGGYDSQSCSCIQSRDIESQLASSMPSISTLVGVTTWIPNKRVVLVGVWIEFSRERR